MKYLLAPKYFLFQIIRLFEMLLILALLVQFQVSIKNHSNTVVLVV